MFFEKNTYERMNMMFDFGWQEFIVIAFVLILVVGPKDLPHVLKAFRKFTQQARQMAYQFTTALEEATSDTALDDVKTLVSEVKSKRIDGRISSALKDNAITSELTDLTSDLDFKKSDITPTIDKTLDNRTVSPKKPKKPAKKDG